MDVVVVVAAVAVILMLQMSVPETLHSAFMMFVVFNDQLVHDGSDNCRCTCIRCGAAGCCLSFSSCAFFVSALTA